MAKTTQVSIRNISNGWIYSIMDWDPMNMTGPKQEEFFANTLEDVFDQLRRKVGDPAGPSGQNQANQQAKQFVPYQVGVAAGTNSLPDYFYSSSSTGQWSFGALRGFLGDGVGHEEAWSREKLAADILNKSLAEPIPATDLWESMKSMVVK